jgi:hypothetical protein
MTNSIFGKDYQQRKNVPVFSFLVGYFPRAIREIVRVCVAGNMQHNKEVEPTAIYWAKGKSTDQLNTAQRHMMDHAITGPFDEEPPEVQALIGGPTYHLAKAAWRIMAELENTIQKEERVASPLEYCNDCGGSHTKEFGEAFHGRIIRRTSGRQDPPPKDPLPEKIPPSS